MFRQPSAADEPWAVKVLSREYALLSQITNVLFPEISNAYRERAELHAKIVRGEIAHGDFVRREQANEKKKNALYEKYYLDLQRKEGAITQTEMESLDSLAQTIADEIAGQAKLWASD